MNADIATANAKQDGTGGPDTYEIVIRGTIAVSQAITAPQEHTAAAGATTGSAPEERPRIPTVDWDAPAPESRDRVKVKNIISPDALRELTASVQQHEPATTVEPKARQESAAAWNRCVAACFLRTCH